ncbi:MAG: RagB/SusD family nutrient uptake outer membrane protein [Bacteroidales bacterium]|nr:RagB/SusD family nutrient uptake outer membrane protein [Bacteroidales bacterium]MDZ4204316.1 RagB/SusD family nutrient uptake outer membrane protein [Bacteroidales bacterium]
MKKYIFRIAILLSTMIAVSCVKDLDITPKDKSTILSGNLGDDPAYLQQALGKIYASFIIAGQGNPGGSDIAASDEHFFTTTRALWNLQELPTDEAICAWGDVGIADLNTQTWSSSNPFLTAVYQRLGLSITFANEFIRFTKDNTDPKVKRYNAEARFLRALAYYWYLDLFGNPPFTTDADGVGKFFPKQLDENFAAGRIKLFNYIASELKSIEPILGDPGFSYPQADKGAAWMLLARLYLNAQVYTGTAKWDSCRIYSDKVVTSGKYSLASNYRKNFSADNGGNENTEMIFAWAQDGTFIQGWVGTTFIIQSSSDAQYLRSEVYHGLTSNTNWNGNRATKQFLNVMIDTLATYSNNPVPWIADPFFAQSKDKRVFLRVKKSPDIPSASSSGDYGIGVYKFTAKKSDGTFPATFNNAFANTDFPVFRYADALLMRAEANYRLGNAASAVTDINLVRQRAFGNTTGNITTAQLNDKFMLDERAREFYYEAQRRTDLIRFGQFTSGTYRWAWKGGVFLGTQTSNHMNVYPIPAEEIAANPFLKQNPLYN